ncbi:MAG: oxidase [Pedosphaera sp.]|nr:oxidase [Pedosphaera sp.]
MSAKIVPIRIYVLVWVALMILLLLTWGAAQFNLGEFNVLTAMTIAVIKMVLVMLYFMHVRYSNRLVWLFAGAGFIWLLINFTLTMSDYATRGEVNPYLKGLPDFNSLPNQLPGEKPGGPGAEKQ